VAALDVAVIGGGIVGVSTAAHLAAGGARVTVFEREAVAAGASGRNSGVVQRPFDRVLEALHLETLELYRRLAAGGHDVGLGREPAGLLYVGHDEAGIAALAEGLALERPALAPRFLPAGAARILEPALGSDVAACRVTIGYPVAPAAATGAYAAWARALGARFVIGGEARPWVDAGAVRGVMTAKGPVAAGSVVVAAGPWTPALVDRGGTWRPITPRWGVVVEVGLTAPPSHVLEEAAIDIEPGDDEAEPPVPRAAHVDFSLVTAAGSSSLGSTFLRDEPDPGEYVAALVERGARFVPAIAGARLGGVRACARPQALDGRPLVGPVSGVAGLWIAAGHGPWGISTGPASGRLVADLVLGRPVTVPAALDPARFGPIPLPGGSP
jgi:glycine/D-amino acid oxidase-like deaminating enzyme